MSATTLNVQTPTTLPSGADRTIAFGRLVRVELGKATDTRAARWLLGLTVAATLALALTLLFLPNDDDQKQLTYLQFTALALSTLLPVATIMTVTSEWSQRTVLTTFIQEPRRARVVLAKVAATMLMALVAVGFGAVVTAVTVGIANAVGRDVAANLGVGDGIGYVLFIVANVAMGVALGALLQNTAAAIVVFFVVPVAFGIIGSFAGSVTRWIDPGTTFNWMVDGDWHGHGLRIVASAVLWIGLPLAAGLVRTVRREIT